MDNLPYEHIRWIENTDIDVPKLSGTSDMKKVMDLKGRPLLLFVNEWSIRMTQERNDGLVLAEFAQLLEDLDRSLLSDLVHTLYKLLPLHRVHLAHSREMLRRKSRDPFIAELLPRSLRRERSRSSRS